MNNIVNSTGINILQDTNHLRHLMERPYNTLHIKELKNEEDIANFKEIIIKDKKEKITFMDFLIKEICIFLYVKIINKYDLEYYLVMNKSIDKYEYINNNHLFNYIKASSYFRSLNLPSNVEDYVKIENINNLIVDKCMLQGTKGEGDDWYTKVYNKGINIYIDMFNDFFVC